MEFKLLTEEDRELIKREVDQNGFYCFSSYYIPELEIMSGKFYEENFGFKEFYKEIIDGDMINDEKKEKIKFKMDIEKKVPDDFYVWRTYGALEDELIKIHGPGYIREDEVNSDLDLLLEKADKIHYDNMDVVQSLKVC